MSGHARIFPPSSAARRVACPGSAAMELDLPRKASSYAASGTATHTLSEWCLTQDKEPEAFLGRIIEVDGFENEVTQERCDRARLYINYVRGLKESLGATVLVEQKLPVGFLTGEEGAEGTGDAVILAGDELSIVDLKDGQGYVAAENNYQLAMYAASALREYEMLGDFARVRLVIVQPRLDRVSEWACTTTELLDLIDDVDKAAKLGNDAIEKHKAGEPIDQYLRPGEHQCGFCAARSTCPALRSTVEEVICTSAGVDEFDDLTASKALAPKEADAATIAGLLPYLDVVELWVKAVRSRSEELLHEGVHIEGWKLVEGKKGGRRWTSEEQAEAEMKKMRLKRDEMYDQKLISPTSAEKLLKKASPRRWATLQAFITQSGGNPTIARADDSRPAITKTPIAEEFADLTVADDIA
jgi:hypothetical protein